MQAITAKQRAFVDWYCSASVNMNGTEAAKRAGYRGNRNTLASVAKENLRKPQICREVDSRIAKALSGAEITVEAILRRLTFISNRALAVGKYSSAIKCAELQGKYLGMWNGKARKSIDIQDASAEDLAKLLNEICTVNGLDLLALANGRIDFDRLPRQKR